MDDVREQALAEAERVVNRPGSLTVLVRAPVCQPVRSAVVREPDVHAQGPPRPSAAGPTRGYERGCVYHRGICVPIRSLVASAVETAELEMSRTFATSCMF